MVSLLSAGAMVKLTSIQSFSQLGVSYLDLYLVHTPKCLKVGGGLETVWREFEALKQEGLVRSVSCEIATFRFRLASADPLRTYPLQIGVSK